MVSTTFFKDITSSPPTRVKQVHHQLENLFGRAWTTRQGVDYPTEIALKKINTLSTTQLEKADIDNGYEHNCSLDSKKIEI